LPWLAVASPEVVFPQTISNKMERKIGMEMETKRGDEKRKGKGE
jgi:hypothetical protein